MVDENEKVCTMLLCTFSTGKPQLENSTVLLETYKPGALDKLVSRV